MVVECEMIMIMEELMIMKEEIMVMEMMVMEEVMVVEHKDRREREKVESHEEACRLPPRCRRNPAGGPSSRQSDRLTIAGQYSALGIGQKL